MGVCASGGYYVAMAADRVLRAPDHGHRLDRRDLLRPLPRGPDGELGVEDQTLKSGAFKDAGSPLRRMNAAERAQLQSVIDDLYGRFLDVVERAGRGSTPRDDRGASPTAASTARARRTTAGLVDEIGYLPDAVDELEAPRRASTRRASSPTTGRGSGARTSTRPPRSPSRAHLGGERDPLLAAALPDPALPLPLVAGRASP